MKTIKIFYVAFLCLINSGYAQLSFVNNGQQINNQIGRGIVLNDFNNDGKLDAFVTNQDDYRIYFGDGQGKFTDSGQRLPSVNDASGKPTIFDLNGDGRNEMITGSTVWLIDNQGRFTSQMLSIQSSEKIDLGTMQFADLNGDSHLDIFALRNYTASRVYLNDGTGKFQDTGQRLGDGTIGKGQLAKIALGDINGDGFIDAVTAGWKWDGSTQCPNHVWLNDGAGNFQDSGQLLDEGNSHVHSVVLGDINSDGWLDLILGIQDATRTGRIYMNDGKGSFAKGSNLGGAGGESVALADFDNDGDRDILVAQSTPPSRVWLNNGNGVFQDSGVRLGNNCSWDVAVGDFNGDEKLDAFMACCVWNSNGLSPAPSQIWLNTTTTDIKEEKDKNTIPNNFYLDQNYPNPFNPSTVINYRLTESDNVKIKIYDTLGREIKTLVDSFQSAGEHSIVWDATDNSNNPISSGVYFYKMETQKTSIQKKMILMR